MHQNWSGGLLEHSAQITRIRTNSPKVPRLGKPRSRSVKDHSAYVRALWLSKEEPPSFSLHVSLSLASSLYLTSSKAHRVSTPSARRSMSLAAADTVTKNRTGLPELRANITFGALKFSVLHWADPMRLTVVIATPLTRACGISEWSCLAVGGRASRRPRRLATGGEIIFILPLYISFATLHTK